MHTSTCLISATPMNRFLSRSRNVNASKISSSDRSAAASPPRAAPVAAPAPAPAPAAAAAAAAPPTPAPAPSPLSSSPLRFARLTRCVSSNASTVACSCGYATPRGPSKSNSILISPVFSAAPHLLARLMVTQASMNPRLNTGSSGMLARPIRSSLVRVSSSYTSSSRRYWSTTPSLNSWSQRGIVPPSLSVLVRTSCVWRRPLSRRRTYGSCRPNESVSSSSRPSTHRTKSVPAG
mmetsp:Transcript_27912/g.90052  ORF Transcript_27912/g.90052 Transcript_27912/m.90052 type:complete len:236 (+) Transcript_27912:869-1576(+)